MRTRLFFLYTCLMLATIKVEAQTTRYVKTGGSAATAAGSATSWTTACSDLQAVINVSASGDRVWVAKGTYIPNRPANNTATISSGNRDNAFVMKIGVKIYGGFAGTETSVTLRDTVSKTNESILTGRLNSTDSTYHVVISSADSVGTSELNGFTITGGNANSTASITVNGFSFTRNSGAGIALQKSSPVLANLTVIKNTGTGGGAGMFILNSSPRLNNVSLADNKTTGTGGGMMNSSSSPVLNNVSITGNTAINGGGIFNISSAPTLTNVTISNNTATAMGGGMFCSGSSAPVLSYVIISGNTAASLGGAMHSIASNPSLTNVLISGNKAPSAGGVSNQNSSPTLINVTISGNAATTGGGLYNAGTSNPAVRNSIIWGNSSGVVNSGSVPVFTNSIIEQSGGSAAWIPATGTNNGNNLDRSPQFVNAPSYTTAPFSIGDYRLDQSSAARDAGNNSLFPDLTAATTDLAGMSRVYNYTTGGIIDMGAYEYIVLIILPANLTAFSANNNGKNVVLQWSTAAERNNLNFEIQRSTNGRDFEIIGKLAGDITGKYERNYSFTDMAPLPGNNYYQLKQVDTDGRFTFSETKRVYINNDEFFSLYPNPAANQIIIETKQAGEIAIYNMAGAVVIKQTLQPGTHKVSVNHLKAGMYIVHLNARQSKFIKL